MGLLKRVGHLAMIIILTALTQVGGLIWLLAIVISISAKKRKRIVFPLLYLLFNLLIVPPMASYFGRERLPWFNKNLKPRNWFYPLAFRNYVNPELKLELENATEILSKSNISITYLDANFPFFDGFPLLPHLSHNDGKKIDLAFMYIDEQGISTNKKLLIEKQLEGAFNIVAPQPTTNTYLMQTIRTAMTVPFGIPQPKWLLKFGAKLIGTEPELVLKSRNVVPERLTENGFLFLHPKIENALKNLLKS